ncbi:TIR domain-containing protein [Lacihabitans sp. LS3-19]|uniref:toll/interleukin-1 receptor domain-containing protein n=1 Tax=Lacihabitans sp. LS3-19 TaxID=2487335 RepID=UPI0020CC1BE9|nr:toll/interleukin-1 receptor domain-containing protein [Lacihabitans sp. LS3-19]MCP9767909.1 TIR domain-containing protein [Lacihabitans sp. LS3-19]
MSIITEAQLRQFQRPFKKGLQESLIEYRNQEKYLKTTIFLSHKHNELEFLANTVELLKSLNTNIYVDWLDEGMPKNTSGETAKRIKKKIVECDKFILLATEAAISSKWCNWELGLGDAAKFDKNIAIFPIRKEGQTFTGSEYFQIYPSIQYENGLTKYFNGNYIPEGYYVERYNNDNTKSIEPLGLWLFK